VTILATLLVGMGACSLGMGEDARNDTVHRGEAVTHERTVAPERSTGARDSWDYVALGDSLAVGIGARRGYVERYASYIGTDTGARVEVVNLGQSGQTSSQLLYDLRNDPSMRQTLGAAEIITFNIGINDLGYAGEAYENGTCGGHDNQECLHTAVETLEANWDAIVAELLSLRTTDDAMIRTVGIGYTPRVDEVFKPYVDEVNDHIATTAANNDIPYAQPYLGKEDIGPDGVHPNANGYEVIADRLRKLGYRPLPSTR
jgi:lysophospholipase L1-like esterase